MLICNSDLQVSALQLRKNEELEALFCIMKPLHETKHLAFFLMHMKHFTIFALCTWDTWPFS